MTSCPGCTARLRGSYGLEPMHILEHIYEDVGIKKLNYRTNGPSIKVALHRPCHLVRSVGPHVIDYAIDILQESPRVILKEVDNDESCCGGGGGVASYAPDDGHRLSARMRTNEALLAGADILLAPCPFCTINLKKVGNMMVEDLYLFLQGLLE